MQPSSWDISNNTSISLRNAPFAFQPQALNTYQNQENKLEIDNKALILSFSLHLRLFGVEKPDQVKPYRRLFSSLNNKNLFAKKKNLTVLCNKSFRVLSMLISTSING